jgi:spermidine synthase
VTARTTHATAHITADPARSSGRTLYLDGVECSYVDLDDPTNLEFQYIRRLADVIDLVPDGPQPLRVTHLGGGGFTLPGYVRATRPRSRQLVYEYDEALVDLARRELGLRTSAGLRVKIGDARERLARRSDGSADVVIGDAFVAKAVPRPLATVEFAQMVKRVLVDGGRYAMNLIDAPPFGFARPAARALLEVFADVALCTDPDVLRARASGNIVLIASSAPLPIAELTRRASRGALVDRVLDRAGTEAFTGAAHALRD